MMKGRKPRRPVNSRARPLGPRTNVIVERICTVMINMALTGHWGGRGKKPKLKTIREMWDTLGQDDLTEKQLMEIEREVLRWE